MYTPLPHQTVSPIKTSILVIVHLILYLPLLPVYAQSAVPSQVAAPVATKENAAVLPDEVKVDDRIGARLVGDFLVRNEQGKEIRLETLTASGRPSVLIPVYYGCPLLCTVTLNRFIDALSEVPYEVGVDFSVLAFSIDPRERPKLAAEKKASYLKAYPQQVSGWHFLTAEPQVIRSVTQEVGFYYKYDAATMEYLHRAAAIFLDGRGGVVRYLHGSDFKAGAIRLALLEAGQGNLGTWTDRVVAQFFKYDPQTRRYIPNLLISLIAVVLVLFALTSLTVIGIRWLKHRALHR